MSPLAGGQPAGDDLAPRLKRLIVATLRLEGLDPESIGDVIVGNSGPSVPATEQALGRAGLTLADLDLIELNEAFAAQTLAVMKEWGFGGIDRERVNLG